MRRLEGLDAVNAGIRRLRVNKGNVSDGSHTFSDLYQHRTALLLYAMKNTRDKRTWIAKYHFDGTMHNGYFIAGIGDRDGDQITYHCKLDWWDKFANLENVEVYEASPFEWDGHTSDDVIGRLTGGDM